MLYDFNYMWNLKNKTNEQTQQYRNKARDREQTGGYQKEIGEDD